jgi:predicted GIY-YIG superfamily endonuclease
VKYHVYGIKQKDADVFIYIGVSQNPQERFAQHITSRYQQKTALQKRFSERYDDLTYVVLSEHEYKLRAHQVEGELIRSYESIGHPLLNRVYTVAYDKERADKARERAIRSRQPEQVELRASRKRLRNIEYQRYVRRVSAKRISKTCGFAYEEAVWSGCISKEQYDIVAKEFPIFYLP